MILTLFYHFWFRTRVKSLIYHFCLYGYISCGLFLFCLGFGVSLLFNFILRSFMYLSLTKPQNFTFRSLVHFDFIFMCATKFEPELILLYVDTVLFSFTLS